MAETIELKLTTKKPASFYVRAAATFFRGTDDKAAVDELIIAGLGNAVTSAVDVAARVERDHLATITKIETSYVSMETSMCPRVSITMKRATPVAIFLQLELKKECVDEFIEIMTAAAVGSRAEDGCMRYDLLRDKENGCKFATYEVFSSPEAMDVHKEMPYVKKWGAFQFGDKKPIISKVLMKANTTNFQSGKPQTPASTPLAVVLQAELKEDCVTEFLEVMAADAVGTRHEDGCLRFDLIRDKEHSNKFATIEVFTGPEAVVCHGGTPHCKAWGAFQYGDKKPVASKTVTKYDCISFDSV